MARSLLVRGIRALLQTLKFLQAKLTFITMALHRPLLGQIRCLRAGSAPMAQHVPPSAHRQKRSMATIIPPVTQSFTSSKGPTAMVFMNMGGPSTTDEVGDFLSRLFVSALFPIKISILNFLDRLTPTSSHSADCNHTSVLSYHVVARPRSKSNMQPSVAARPSANGLSTNLPRCARSSTAFLQKPRLTSHT